MCKEVLLAKLYELQHKFLSLDVTALTGHCCKKA